MYDWTDELTDEEYEAYCKEYVYAPKYKVTIEFSTSDDLPFPVDAMVVDHMQAQLESLEDGTMDNFQTMMVVTSGTITKVVEE